MTKIIIFYVFLPLACLMLVFSFFSAKSIARDKIRIADVTTIQKALNYYFQDNQTYPVGDGMGKPRNFGAYLAQWPSAPTPSDGECKDEENIYRYTKDGEDNYKITFCIGKSRGDYEQGINVVSQ